MRVCASASPFSMLEVGDLERHVGEPHAELKRQLVLRVAPNSEPMLGAALR